MGARRRRWAAVLTALVTTLGWLVGAGAPTAQADTTPAQAGVPETVSADPLPTWQVTGVVWSQVVVGTTVYATGSFTRARPPGMWQGGPTEIAVGHLIAYDITTGARIASFDHVLDAQGLTLAASPDGRRVYVGGDFTTVDGQSRPHLAAFDTATGALVPDFAPTLNGQVRALAVSGTTVYAGGRFTGSGTAKRRFLASFSTSDGALTSWAPQADDGYVWSMTLTPDKAKVVVGGQFSTLNGLTVYGIGAVDATTGASLPWAASGTFRDYKQAAVDSLTTDGTSIYGGAFNFGTGGNFEGTFSLNPADGSVRWLADCLGDTYDVQPVGAVVYSVSHAHNCTDVGGFPDTSPRSRWQHAMAFTAAATQVNSGPSAYGWDHSGVPAPSILQWFPNLGIGVATGQYQAAWDVASGAGYVALGGEFPTVEGKPQQGLTRYALRGAAANTAGPRYENTVPIRTGAPRTTAVATAAGTVRVGFGAAWDPDNQRLTYRVYRDRGTAAEALVSTLTADSTFWTLPAQAVVDTAVPAGDHTYQVRITDPTGNELLSPVSSPVDASTTLPPYASQVLVDGADHYWRLGETGTPVLDAVGEADGASRTGVTRGSTGALSGDGDLATSFNGGDGASVGLGAGPTPAPTTFTVEGWFRTTSTRGGKVVGFSSTKNDTSPTYDRQVYLGPTGKVSFGLSASKAVTSPTPYNDGAWHHVAASLGTDGATLWLDGRLVARDRSATTAGSYSGYWRLGGDAQASSWPNAPTSGYLSGTVDEVATYPAVLTQAQVVDHFVKSGRTSTAPTSAPSDAYGAAVANGRPDLFWRLGDGSGPVAGDSSPNDNRGLFLGSPAYGQAGALTTVAGKSVGLTSAGAGVASASSFAAPSSYSEELWFRTTTTTGGKLVGFGSSPSGASTTVDRNLTMTDAGRLRFATTSGGAQVSVDTPKAYNDGAWHHVVAAQAPGGMQVVVDGVLVASNQVNATSSMVGWWRVGYDTVWSGSTSSTFLGQVDEVAVYPRVLSLSEAKAHFRAGGGTVANLPPSAGVTVAQAGLDVSFSGATSSDPDGSVTGYAWTFGDQTTATGVAPSHTYARAGTYPVVLTVTDDAGAKAAVQRSITVTNGLPTPAFQATASQRTVSLDGSASKDDDGSVVAWGWTFGDGTSATGAKPSHTYAKDGTYTVTLTVTDNAGATATTSQQVSVAQTQAPVARVVASPTGVRVAFDGSTSSDPDGTVTAYSWDFGDGTDSAEVRPTHTYARAGTYVATLTVTDDKRATGRTTTSLTLTDAAPVPSFTSSTAGLTASFDSSASKDADGSVVAWSWSFGDGSTSDLASPRRTYAKAGTYTVGLTVTDDLGTRATTTRTVTVRADNAAPTAALAVVTSDLTATFDGSGSTDQDGRVSTWAWDFGDGSSGTGTAPKHTYSADGAYTVRLTVTDDRGATGTTTRAVTVRGPLARDSFARTATSGWGTADRGGAWTTTSPGAFSVAGGKGSVTVASKAQPTARLAVRSTDTDLQVGFALDRASTGGGQFVRTIVRGDETNGYGTRVWVTKDGAMSLALTRVVGGTETDLGSPRVLPGAVVPGTTYRVRTQVWGTGTTNLRTRVWVAGTTEPSTWQLATTDTTPGLQAAGGVALRAYLSGSATNGPMTVSFSDLVARPTQG